MPEPAGGWDSLEKASGDKGRRKGDRKVGRQDGEGE
jgi:hypothetical protein